MAWQVSDPHSARVYRRLLAFFAGSSLAFYYGIFGGGFDPDPRGFAAILIWAVIAIGLAAGLLPRTRLPRGWQVAAGLLIALAAWTALSLVWSGSSEKTVIEVTRILHYGGIVALAWLTLDRHTVSAAAAGVFAGAALITALALASRLMPGVFPEPDLASVGGAARRLEYPLGYWNALGAWAAMTAAMAVAWAAHARGVALRAVSAAVIPVAGAVTYLTYSRGSVAAIAIGIGAVVLASERRWSAALIAFGGGCGTAVAVLAIRDNQQIAEALGSAGAGSVAAATVVGAGLAVAAVVAVLGLDIDRWRVGRDYARGAAAALAATVVIVVVAAIGTGFVADVWEKVGSDVESTGQARAPDRDSGERLTGLQSNRADVYRSAIDAYETDPVFGIGAGSFEFWWTQNPTTTEYIVDAHSIYLEALAELGPIGLVLLVSLFGWLFVIALRTRLEGHSARRSGAAAAAIGTLAVFAVQGTIDWFWEYAGLAALAFGSVAIAASGTGGLRRRAPLGPPVRIALTLVAVAMVAIQFLPWSSIRAVRASEDAIAAADPGLALERARDAASLQGWAARPHAQLARAHAAAGELKSAIREIRLAIDREPTNWRHRAQLAGLERAAGRGARGDLAYKKALSLYRLPPAPVEFVAGEMQQLASR